jgi:aarF domain-containing kinase
MEALGKRFAGRRDVIVPSVVPELTHAGILTMSYEEGVKITDRQAQSSAGIDPEQVARLLVECYFTMLFEYRLLHADPHPGNFLVRPGPTLVILDYGAVEPITEALVEGIKTVVLGAVTRNDEQILQGLRRMGFVAEGGDTELLRKVGREYLKALGAIKIENFSQLDRETIHKLSGFSQVRGQLREIMKSVEYPEGYLYVERTLVLLFGLLGQLAPKAGLPGLVLPYAAKVFASPAATGSTAAPA